MEGTAWMPTTTRDDLFTEVIDRHHADLVRRLAAVVGDMEAARDLAQETYLRAYRAWARFDGHDARAWLYTIALRLAFNERDRRRRWRAILRQQPTEVPAWVRPDHRDLHRALRGLPRPRRIAIFLNAVDGYTQAEIAAMLDVPPGTVASWIARANATLREVLRDD